MLALCQAPKQLERTVMRRHGRAASASFHYAHAARWTLGHAAAELRRYAAEYAAFGLQGLLGGNTMVTKAVPEGVQAVFPMLVCQSPEAEMNFCAAAFGAVEQVRRPGPDGSPIHIAMRINEAFLVVQSEFPDVVASRAPSPDGSSSVVIFVYVADVDQAVERAVAVGARILIPAQNQFWGDRTARIIDPSGHVWTVASRIEETSEEQRAKRWSDTREGKGAN